MTSTTIITNPRLARDNGDREFLGQNGDHWTKPENLIEVDLVTDAGTETVEVMLWTKHTAGDTGWRETRSLQVFCTESGANFEKPIDDLAGDDGMGGMTVDIPDMLRRAAEMLDAVDQTGGGRVIWEDIDDPGFAFWAVAALEDNDDEEQA